MALQEAFWGRSPTRPVGKSCLRQRCRSLRERRRRRWGCLLAPPSSVAYPPECPRACMQRLKDHCVVAPAARERRWLTSSAGAAIPSPSTEPASARPTKPGALPDSPNASGHDAQLRAPQTDLNLASAIRSASDLNRSKEVRRPSLVAYVSCERNGHFADTSEFHVSKIAFS